MYHIFKCLQWVININKKNNFYAQRLFAQRKTYSYSNSLPKEQTMTADYNLLLTTMKRYEDDNRHR